jgi:site-specific DNA-methyltransferase (adenine-specific)
VTCGFGGESGLLESGPLSSDHVRGIARVLRPGGHLFHLRYQAEHAWFYERLCRVGLEYRGSVVRVGPEPKKVRKSDDLFVRAEFHDLYRKRFEGTVARCLREHQTGGLRRVSAERPFTDVIHSDDRADFLAQLRRAALPLGCGTIVDPYRLKTWRVARTVAQAIAEESP